MYTLYSSIIVPVHQRREEVSFGSVEAERYVGVVDGHAGLHTAQACGVHFTHSDLAAVDTGRQKGGVWMRGASEFFPCSASFRGVGRHQRPGTCIAGTWLERDAGLCAIRAASQVTEHAPRNNCGKILCTITSHHLLRPSVGSLCSRDMRLVVYHTKGHHVWS